MSRIKEGNKIKTPTSNFIWTKNTSGGDEIYQFPYSNSYKLPDKDSYTNENYIVEVVNVKPHPETEYYVSKLIETYPKVNVSKDGRSFLNCVAVVKLDMVKSDNQNNYNEMKKNNYVEKRNNYSNENNINNSIVDDDTLPF